MNNYSKQKFKTISDIFKRYVSRSLQRNINIISSFCINLFIQIQMFNIIKPDQNQIKNKLYVKPTIHVSLTNFIKTRIYLLIKRD